MSGISLPETSAEVRLLGALCRPRESTPDGRPPLKELVAAVRDWSRFVELLQHHRLLPIAARNAAFMGLPELPAETRTVLQAWSIANAREAFRYVAVLQQLLALLTKEGIDALVLKGVPLSVMAHGDVSARDVGDIDLLIEEQHALRADEVLRKSGLARKEPAAMLTPRRAAFYLRTFKDFTYDAPAGGFEVDLHWRLLRDARTASAIMPTPLQGHAEAIRIGTLDLQIMPIERTLLFLCAHGAMEGWARWKTLADVAALWDRSSLDQRTSTWALARKSSTTGFLAAALVLAGEWFSIAYGPQIAFHLEEAELSERRRCTHIVVHARHQMLQDNYMPSPAGSSVFAMKVQEARLHPSATSRLALAKRILFRPRMWELFDLPDSLFSLYPLLSPMEWLSFRLKKTAARSGGH